MPSSPWIPASATIAAVFIAGVLQFLATADSFQREADEDRRIAQEKRVLNLVTLYHNALAHGDSKRRAGVRLHALAIGSPAIVNAFARIECSENIRELQKAFRDLVGVLRNEIREPENRKWTEKVTAHHIDILVPLKMKKSRQAPEVCQR